MIRTECTKLIKHLFQNGKINELMKIACLEIVNEEDTHREIRNLVMMILLPKRLHFDGAHQAAFLRAAVSRASKLKIVLKLNLNFRSPIKPYWSKRDCSSFGRFMSCCLREISLISTCPVQVLVYVTKHTTIHTKESKSDQMIYRSKMQSIKNSHQVKSKL